MTPAPPTSPSPSTAGCPHPAWDSGQVMGYEGDTVTVFFESVGYKTLALELVRAGDLLTPEA